MMMARKWDRIENLCKAKGYDVFKALENNDGDILDDLKDLVGYLLLILDHVFPKEHDEYYQGWLPENEDYVPFTVEGHRGDGNNLYKCKKCKTEIWAKTIFEADKAHHHDNE